MMGRRRTNIESADPMPDSADDLDSAVSAVSAVSADTVPRTKRKYAKRVKPEEERIALPPEISAALGSSIGAVARIPFARRAQITGDDRWILTDDEAAGIGRGFTLWIDFRLGPYLGVLGPELLLLAPILAAVFPRVTMRPRPSREDHVPEAGTA